MYRTLFANVNRSILAHDLIARVVVERRVDFLAVAEPNRYEAAKSCWIADTQGDVAIMVINHNIHWRLRFRGRGVVALENETVMIVSVYVSPIIELAEFTCFVDIPQGLITNSSKRLVMLGDFNSKMVMAGSSYTNRRGQILVDLLETTGCHCINDGTPTYVARGHQSVLDLTILDNRWKSEQYDWMVLLDDIASDHRATILDLRDANFERVEYPPLPSFSAEQIELIVNRTADRLKARQQQTPEALSNIIKEIDRVASNAARRRNVYWWTTEIGNMRQELQSLRRRKQRLLRNGREDYQDIARRYIETRTALNRAIKKKEKRVLE
ncbi:uncharacterized protein LOC142319953 [Lycorma delicatula]|uniref:uncharacterized protein LOC142319953 n=1 Tax=Lycorma delicatula TaxID=130591 RepID=UPI003F510BFF